MKWVNGLTGRVYWVTGFNLNPLGVSGFGCNLNPLLPNPKAAAAAAFVAAAGVLWPASTAGRRSTAASRRRPATARRRRSTTARRRQFGRRRLIIQRGGRERGKRGERKREGKRNTWSWPRGCAAMGAVAAVPGGLAWPPATGAAPCTYRERERD